MPIRYAEPLANIQRNIYLTEGEQPANLFLLDIDEEIYSGTFHLDNAG